MVKTASPLQLVACRNLAEIFHGFHCNLEDYIRNMALDAFGKITSTIKTIKEIKEKWDQVKLNNKGASNLVS